MAKNGRTNDDDPFLADRGDSGGDLAPYRRRSTDISLRQGASREEQRTFQELHRQSLAVRVEKAIIAVGAMSLGDLQNVIEQIGLDVMQHSQDRRAEAEATLNPEFFSKFRAWLRKRRLKVDSSV